MNFAKALAGALALGRAAFGLNYVVRPQEANKTWIGPVAKVPGTQVIVRSQGARDIALGGGALRALARGDDRELRAWVLGQTVADAADALATWVARGRLPTQSRLALRVAVGSALVGAVAAAGLSRPERSEASSAPRSA